MSVVDRIRSCLLQVNKLAIEFYRKRGAFFNLVRTSSYNWSREDHRELLRGMTMTVCDLAAITKPWEVEKRVS